MSTEDSKLEIAKRVLEVEGHAILGLIDKLSSDFQHAIEAILDSKGKVIVSGMGKSGIVGKKIAATLASTGTPSFFVHPGEAYHGDLGMIESHDIAILISNSGESDEVLKLISFFKDNGNLVIAMTSEKNSTLARNSEYQLDISVQEEACPLRLAPTASTTATLALGDALAVTLMQAREFDEANYARFHPGGSIGRRLLTTIKDVMKTHEGMVIPDTCKMMQVVHAITKGRCGLAVVTNSSDQVIGVVTDGDLRRAMESNQDDFFDLSVDSIMTPNPQKIDVGEKIFKAEQLMNEKKISSLLVYEEDSFIGVVEMYDLSN